MQKILRKEKKKLLLDHRFAKINPFNVSKNQLFDAYFDFYNPPVAHFHGFYHENCALMHAGGVLEPRKFDNRGLKGRLDVKKATFKGLVAKMGLKWPI